MENNRLSFTVEAEDSATRARAGRFCTLHNDVLTPVFMPVATFAALRNQDTESVHSLGFPIILANTYHLLLRPGPEVFRKIGGIHSFMNWPRSVLTDSGGFQVYSLSESVQISEEGALFRSYVDGRRILLTPESSVEMQLAAGSDIMMALDQCVPSTCDESIAREAVETTARWAERSLAARGNFPNAIFGIVQGACSPLLRRLSARQITDLPFDAYAIGGLAVGETALERQEITAVTAELLPVQRPRYLMGVGTPLDILHAVASGIDMFDCIIPTLLGEQGICFTSRGRLDLRRGAHKHSQKPVDESCHCPACSRYSRAYLHHLVKAEEYFGKQLLGFHNLVFYGRLMASIREKIVSGTFESFYRQQQEELQWIDDEFPRTPPRRKRRVPLELGDYQVVEQQQGFHSIRHKVSGEVMHSVSNPMDEAQILYVDQAGLAEALPDASAGDFVVWDVGLGAATNAMATLLHLERHFRGSPCRKVRMVSFEHDLDSLRLAIRHAARFPHLQHSAPSSMLENGKWSSPIVPFEWELIEGDFTEKMEQAPSPHCIYYDLYSLNTLPEVWTVSFFSRIFSCCPARYPSRILTYSNSTQVRAAMLAAGFYIARGAGTGPKDETTIAISCHPGENSGLTLLGREWLERFERSGAAIDEAVKIKVRAHLQFSDSSKSGA